MGTVIDERGTEFKSPLNSSTLRGREMWRVFCRRWDCQCSPCPIHKEDSTGELENSSLFAYTSASLACEDSDSNDTEDWGDRGALSSSPSPDDQSEVELTESEEDTRMQASKLLALNEDSGASKARKAKGSSSMQRGTKEVREDWRERDRKEVWVRRWEKSEEGWWEREGRDSEGRAHVGSL
jgi:hypothetical protein